MFILVTGGAGYIGSVLVHELLNAGYKVRVVDNFMYRQNSLGLDFHNRNLEVVKGDVRDIELIRRLTKDVDVVIPLAAIVGAPACDLDPKTATAVNKLSIRDMFRNLSGNQWVLMPTTNSAYGKTADNFPVSEDAPLNPLSLYARDKVYVEMELMQRSNSTSFRLATVFGMSPRMRTDLMVNNFVKSAINPGYIVIFEGRYRRNFIHVRDVCGAFLFALENHEEFSGEIFNVGLSDANMTKSELAEEVKKQIPSFTIVNSEIGKDPDQRDYLVSNRKIESLGFKPKFSLAAGITELNNGLRTLALDNFTNLR